MRAAVRAVQLQRGHWEPAPHGITGGLGGRKGITPWSAMPQCAPSILYQAGTPEHRPEPCNLFLAVFPCQSLAGGSAWGLCGSVRRI